MLPTAIILAIVLSVVFILLTITFWQTLECNITPLDWVFDVFTKVVLLVLVGLALNYSIMEIINHAHSSKYN